MARNSKLDTAQRKDKKQQATDKLLESGEDAINRIVSLMGHPDPKISLTAATYIADQAIGRARQSLPEDDNGNKIDPLALFTAMAEARVLKEQEVIDSPGGAYNDEGTYVINDSVTIELEKVEDEEPERSGTGVVNLGGDGAGDS